MNPNTILRFAFAAFLWPWPAVFADSTPLDTHFVDGPNGGETRGLVAEWRESILHLSGTSATHSRYTWTDLLPPASGWDLARRAAFEAEITNTGETSLELLLWVVGDQGWDAVSAATTIEPGERHTLSCNLRETYPDKTPKIDPGLVKHIRVMPLRRGDQAISLELHHLRATGSATDWQRPAGRLEVPPVEDSAPAPGHRVRFRLPGEESPGIYSILHLPEDWEPGRSYPVIAEYPGNQFYTKDCYSTGLPDQCVIGHGITKGRSSICVGLPFVDPVSGRVMEHGWGDADATADYAVRMMEEVCAKFGGDRENLVLTGFSRGAIACGYIGLRNDRIAALWKGFHACQHYDGGGWNGATREGALERAKRFRGKSVFQTDNAPKHFQAVMEAMNTEVIWAMSGLDAHATAMFLDERESTLQLRKWFRELVSMPGN